MFFLAFNATPRLICSCRSFFIKRVPYVLEKIFQIYNDTQYNFYDTISDMVFIKKIVISIAIFFALSHPFDSFSCSWLDYDASRPK